jgi:3-methyladenine DNA glycosylase AlkD
MMNIQQARDTGGRISSLINDGKIHEADDILLPILHEKTPFPVLGAIGMHLGTGDRIRVDGYLDQIAAGGTMGGWVVIASALRSRIPVNMPDLFSRCRTYTLMADTWYGVDIFGERVPGPALTLDFDQSVELLKPWRPDPNRWIRRMVGVAVHYRAKQAHGKDQFRPQVLMLLDLLDPMFSEKEYDAVKGVGWGLKTLGKFYPELLADWLVLQVRKPHSALMMRKAMKFLTPELRAKVLRKNP